MAPGQTYMNKGLLGATCLESAMKLDSPVHYIFIQCVALFWSFGRVCGMIIIDQLRIILVCITP